jgi:hypothetical protein
MTTNELGGVQLQFPTSFAILGGPLRSGGSALAYFTTPFGRNYTNAVPHFPQPFNQPRVGGGLRRGGCAFERIITGKPLQVKRAGGVASAGPEHFCSLRLSTELSAGGG